MTEYWKSTPKHYCEVCRVWIADTPRIVKEHERSSIHQERLSKRLTAKRIQAEKEANEAAKVARTVHDIESKAFASYAADLKARDELKSVEKPRIKKMKDESLHKGKRKIMMEVPKHPLHNIGGHSMPKTGKIGGQQRKITKEKLTTHKSKKVRINEDEEAKARRLRREAQERVKQRNMLNYGLG